LRVFNISYINRKVNGINEFYVCDRNTGKPLASVEAKFFEKQYNSGSRKYDLKLVNTAISDENGYLKSKLKEKNTYGSNYGIKWSHEKDFLSVDTETSPIFITPPC
jgi:hypothetical protein